jgi:enoyl-CoA hydratase
LAYNALNFQKIDDVMIIKMIPIDNDQVKYARLSDELIELCTEIAWDGKIRVVVLTGAEGGSFFKETDLAREFLKNNGAEQNKNCFLTEPIAKVDRPVIAAINGNAIGEGLELALACDIRIAIETSRFGLPHVKAGLIPWDGGTQRLSRLVGKGKALEMILTGEMIDAQEAQRIGLVNKIVSPDKLMPVAMDMAKEMASKGPIALRYAKEAIYKGMDMTLEQGLRLEADLYLLIHTTKDRTEGIKAFQEKRIPKFKGR